MVINENSVSLFPVIIIMFVLCCKIFIKLVVVLGGLYISGINISDLLSFLHSLVEDHHTLDLGYWQSDVQFAVQPDLLSAVRKIQLHSTNI
jgi:hypothetical protein